MRLRCPKCGYAWESKSEKLWVCCPNCMRKSPREKMMPYKYELEKVRMNYEKDWVYTTIQESDSEDVLIEITKKTKIKFGKTFEEKLVLNHIDEYGDIVHVGVLKFTAYDLESKFKPYIVDDINS